MKAAQRLLGSAVGSAQSTCHLRELALQPAVFFDQLTHHLIESFDKLTTGNA
jgi:hypothetical protein